MQTENVELRRVCVCVCFPNFILTSVVLTGLSWGAVLTDRHKEKQQTSDFKCDLHPSLTQTSHVQYSYRKKNKTIYKRHKGNLPQIHILMLIFLLCASSTRYSLP